MPADHAPSIVALIPARSGSKRVADKNIRPLMGHPAMAYTICAARSAGIFDKVCVSTDSGDYAEVARHYGADVVMRPPEMAGDRSPDIDWVEHALDTLEQPYDCFSILRPTSPFRQPETIQRAWTQFLAEREQFDSLRAVQKCREHPAKMWVIRGNRMSPLLPFGPPEQPWHSSQYPSLPEVYVQNASLEIAWSRVVREGRTIAGNSFMPFLTQGFEGVDLNDPEDWFYALHIIEHEGARLPGIDRPAAQLGNA
jgi:CMP-N,N'-diacetyllegionaminic acid synthase